MGLLGAGVSSRRARPWTAGFSSASIQHPSRFKMNRCPRTGNGPLVLLASLVRRNLPEDTDSLAGIAQGHGGVARGHEAAAPAHGQARRLAQLWHLLIGEQVSALE